MSGRVETDFDARLSGALSPYLTTERGRPGLLLGVSGGPDSTALLHAAAHGFESTLHAATVDHGLRPEAAAEAEQVAALCRRLGVVHHILTWQPPNLTSGVQAAARQARYRLLAEHARNVGAHTVLTAHTADDQAETVLMRLAAGSGPAGLAGMRVERALAPDLTLARPFLHLRKADLVAYCHAHDLPFLADPSNADSRFARGRLRTILPPLSSEGLSVERLCRLAERAAREDDALNGMAQAVFERLSRPNQSGGMMLDGGELRHEPEAIVLRVIERAMRTLVDREATFSRLARLERLVLEALLPALHAGAPLRRTLAGLLVEAMRSGEIRMSLAPPRRPAANRAGSPTADLLGKG